MSVSALEARRRGPQRTSAAKNNSIATKIVNGVRKGVVDHCNYKSLRLENDLEVLLISDKQALYSTAALSVKVGYLSDPVEVSTITVELCCTKANVNGNDLVTLLMLRSIPVLRTCAGICCY